MTPRFHEQTFAKRIGHYFCPEADTSMKTRQEIVTEISQQAVEDRIEEGRLKGEMPVAMDVRRYFITAGRGFSITLRCEFVDEETDDKRVGRFACGIRDSELRKIRRIEDALRMFLN